MNEITKKSSSIAFLLRMRRQGAPSQIHIDLPTPAQNTEEAGGSCLPEESDRESLKSEPLNIVADLDVEIDAQTEDLDDLTEQSHVEFLERMESLTMEDSEQYALALKMIERKAMKKSKLEGLPFDLQNHVLDYLPQKDVHSVLKTCKIMSTHSSTQIIRCIRHKNVVFRHQLLIFTFMLRNFVGPERLVDELNSLHEVSAGLGNLFQQLYEDNPVKYVQYRTKIEKEFNNTLEFRKLFAVFVNIVDILLGAFE